MILRPAAGRLTRPMGRCAALQVAQEAVPQANVDTPGNGGAVVGTTVADARQLLLSMFCIGFRVEAGTGLQDLIRNTSQDSSFWFPMKPTPKQAPGCAKVFKHASVV